MSDAERIAALELELEYHKRRLDDLAGESLRQDFRSSKLAHELHQKRKGFAILFELQLLFGPDTPIESILEKTLRSVNSTLDMDKSAVLVPDGVAGEFIIAHWFGYQTSGESIPMTTIRIPDEVTGQSGHILVNGSSADTHELRSLRDLLGLPFFIGVPVVVDGETIGILFAGRTTEKRPFRPPLDQGDLDTLRAIANLVARSIQTKRLAALTAERNRIVNLFGQHVSQAVVDELLERGLDTASARREVCIMFLDIRNFTPLCEKLEPEEVVSYLNTLFEFMIDIVNRRGGIINTFLGDGFMATFGAPIMGACNSRNALDAALEILEQVSHSSLSGIIPPTRIGIGLHAGEAVTGNIGSALRKQYTITGNVVILASRIEQLNKQFDSQLLISESVWEKTGGDIDGAVALGPVSVKGRHKPISLYRLG